MTPTKFLATPEEQLTTVRVVSAEGATEPFNRLLNAIVAGDGNSFVAIEEDAAGAAEGMTVNLPEKRRVIQKVSVKDGIATVHFVIERAVSEPRAVATGSEKT